MCTAGVAHSPTIQRLLESEYVAELNALFKGDTDWWVLLLMILVERHKRVDQPEPAPASFWEPMLRSVDEGGCAPSKADGYTCAYTWGDAEDRILAQSSEDMQITVEGMVAVHEEEWPQVFRILTSFDHGRFSTMTHADYTYAKCFMTTRGIDYVCTRAEAAAGAGKGGGSRATLTPSPETKGVCCPLFDLLNHKPFDEANAQFQVVEKGGVVQVSAKNDIPAGEQIFISYCANAGPGSHADDWYLLHRYGFCALSTATLLPATGVELVSGLVVDRRYVADQNDHEYGTKEAARMASKDADSRFSSDTICGASSDADGGRTESHGVQLCIHRQALRRAIGTFQQPLPDELAAVTPTCKMLVAVREKHAFYAERLMSSLEAEMLVHFGEAAVEAERKRRKKKAKEKRQKAKKKEEAAADTAMDAASSPPPQAVTPSVSIPLFSQYHAMAREIAMARGWRQITTDDDGGDHQKMVAPAYSGAKFIGVAPSSSGSGLHSAGRCTTPRIPHLFEAILSKEDQKIPRQEVLSAFETELEAKLFSTVHMNFYLGYTELKGMDVVGVKVADAVYEQASAAVQKDLNASNIHVFKTSLCVLPLALYTPCALEQVVTAVKTLAGNAPTSLQYSDRVQPYGKHKLVVVTDQACTAALQTFGKKVREVVQELPGVRVGDCPLPHTSLSKVTYSAHSKKEKTAANKLAKAVNFGHVAKTITFSEKELPLDIETTRFKLVQIDGSLSRTFE